MTAAESSERQREKALADKETDSKGLPIHADWQDLDMKGDVERQTGIRTETETHRKGDRDRGQTGKGM